MSPRGRVDPADERVASALHQLTTWHLPGGADLTPLDDVDLGRAVVDAAVEERVIGVLAVAALAGELEAPDEIVTLAVERHREALRWCLRLEVELLRLIDLLGSVGVVPVVLKGPALAHLDEPDPSLRTFADLDLLVAGSAIDRTVALLQADGFTRSWAERRPGWDARFGKSVTLRSADGIETALHRNLCDGAHGFRIPVEELHDRAVAWDLAGTTLLALAPEHRLLHSAYHLALGSPTPRAMSLRDLASALCDPAIDREEVRSTVARWRGEAVLVAAIDRVAELEVDLGDWADWAASTQVTASEAAIVDRQRREGSAIGRAKLDAAAELPWGARMSYLLALAVPSGAHLRSRGLRRRDLVRPS